MESMQEIMQRKMAARKRKRYEREKEKIMMQNTCKEIRMTDGCLYCTLDVCVEDME